MEMLIDVLSDRGFGVSYSSEAKVVPWKVDLQTGEILNKSVPAHSFRITWDTRSVRDAFKTVSVWGAF